MTVNFTHLWPYLGMLTSLQFPYRLETYVALFAALLAGLAFDQFHPIRPWPWALGCLALLIVWFHPYQLIGPTPTSVRDFSDVQAKSGTNVLFLYNFEGNAGSFATELQAATDSCETDLPDGVVLHGPSSAQDPGSQISWGKWTTISFTGISGGTLAVLPSMYYPGLYDFRLNGKEADYGHVYNLMSLVLPPGNPVVTYHFRGFVWANEMSLGGWLLLVVLLAIWLRSNRKSLVNGQMDLTTIPQTSALPQRHKVKALGRRPKRS